MLYVIVCAYVRGPGLNSSPRGQSIIQYISCAYFAEQSTLNRENQDLSMEGEF
jgi:hypothetical protein